MANEIAGLVICFKDAAKRSRLTTRDTIGTEADVFTLTQAAVRQRIR